MSLACEELKKPLADPVDATDAAPVPSGAPVLLEAEDLTILRLIAAGRRRADIAADCYSSLTKIDARTRQLCHVLEADNREHLAALGAVYGLVTREHLTGLPPARPPVDEDDQAVLDLIVAGMRGPDIAAQLQREVSSVTSSITRLLQLLCADNRRNLAAHAVAAEAVACHTVAPRFPPLLLSRLPSFRLTSTGTGVLLHTTPPQMAAGAKHNPFDGSAPAVRARPPAPSGLSRNPTTSSGRTMTPIPAEIATWAKSCVGSHPAWALPNDGSGARSWRMSSAEGIIELRVVRTHGDLQREIYAHRHAVRRLDAGRAPRLLGAEPRLRALLLREPRGERVDDAPDRGLHMAEAVHDQAGQLLRILHDSTLWVGDKHTRAVQNTLLYIDHVDHVLDQTDSPALADHRALIRRRLAVLREYLPQLPSAFCHGSFGPASWRWQRAQRSLSLTGFARCQMMVAAVDFARPSLLWANRPLLRDAFISGYGRPLDELEQHLLGDFAVLATVEDLRHAIRLDGAESCIHLANVLDAAVDRLPIGEHAPPALNAPRHPDP
ncbi:hypothetical protein AB0M25_06170 [Streptomyces griseomycini]|uniref:hypothetical protein n=1 Tax=Streptomyces griseomycini TaxID=66895 RepID=UPI00344279F8